MTEQLQIKITFEFANALAPLNWQAIAFAIEQDIMHPDCAIEMAMDLLATGDESATVLELASLPPDSPVMSHVKEFSATEPEVEISLLQRTWAFILLSWIFNRQENYVDPLDLVEKVYSDLGYPEQVAPFVRYMPSDEPALKTKALNEQRLFEKWADYLKSEFCFFTTNH